MSDTKPWEGQGRQGGGVPGGGDWCCWHFLDLGAVLWQLGRTGGVWWRPSQALGALLVCCVLGLPGGESSRGEAVR